MADEADVDTYVEKRSYIPRKSTPLRRAADRTLQQAGAFLASMEIVGDGVILLNKKAEVSFISESAKAIWSKLNGIVETRDGRLFFLKESNQQHLSRALLKKRIVDAKLEVADVMVIERHGFERPLIISMYVLAINEEEEPRMMLIFRDPDNEPTPQWEIFARHFKLSALEARLSLALADGLTINEYSERFFTSPHTTRTHLKSIFQKTGTRRQGDLLRLIFEFTRL